SAALAAAVVLAAAAVTQPCLAAPVTAAPNKPCITGGGVGTLLWLPFGAWESGTQEASFPYMEPGYISGPLTGCLQVPVNTFGNKQAAGWA
ncbi:MAG: hypothetical protein Q4C00_08355, partial [Bacillota bacterium]|nr:hypothetical protein [Bacillota bacterium]